MDTALDYQNLNLMLDKVKSQIFLGKNAAFFGSLLCSLEFIWSEDVVSTAATDGVSIWWNPHFFLSKPPEVNKTILMHELWHVAKLHLLRQGTRDPEIFNYACDIRINNDLENEGYSFETEENCWKDHSFDVNGIMVEEDIYDELIKNNVKPPPKAAWGNQEGKGDMLPSDPNHKQVAVANVVKAVQQAKLSGNPGSIPGGIEKLLSKFLDPIIPWESLLMRFFTDMLNEEYTWRRPSRRSQEVYLPTRFTDDGRLEHLMYFLDVSGSVSDADVLRFNSEVKYIQETLNPERLTLVQFDTVIQDVTEFTADQPFEAIKVIGRGGTCLECVKDYIEEHKPTAAIIFSDLYCDPMKKLKWDIPLLWAVIGSGITPTTGKTIHIK